MPEKKETILMVGNWKTNPKTIEQAKKLYTDIYKETKKYKNVTTVICPTTLHISELVKVSKSQQSVLGAQDCDWEDTSSKVGEISVAQLKDLGINYCIVGHSNRRQRGESEEIISQKIQGILKKGLTPILCVGESIRDAKGAYISFVEDQVKNSLQGVPKSKVSKVVIAYEPLWAIGKDAKRSATPEEVEEIFIAIRRAMADMYSMKKIPTNKMLYGGSVSSKKDVQDFVGTAGADGCLVGRASLKAKTCNTLVAEADQLSKK